MVIIDLQKTFDIVDNKILLRKLTTLGFHDLSVSWLVFNLTNRNQKTEINGTFSDPRVVLCGIPQGYILGPLLFLMYVNARKAAVVRQLISYADDSTLLVSGNDIGRIWEIVGNDLPSIDGWLIIGSPSI